MMARTLCALWLLAAALAAALAAPVVYRDVKQYGAKGDGVTDDTAAIIRALTEGRADDPAAVYPNAVYSPSTLRPAYVYFPEGVYIVRQTLPVVYNTEMVGNFSALPTIKFLGANTRVLESLSTAWYHDASVNNFYKRISNFIVDMTSCTACTGIHWQVAQATSISNVFFKSGIGSQSQGLWMDDGSGGHLQDITFEGGIYGMWVGNQQFTSRNITIRNTSRAAIYLNWDWAWTFKELFISDSPVGVDVNGGNDPRPQGTGSIVILDSTFTNVDVCVRTGFKAAASPVNTLVLDNVDISGPASTLTIVQNLGVPALTLPGPTAHVPSYIQGQIWANGTSTRGTVSAAAPRTASLLAANGYFFSAPRPQFPPYLLVDVVSVLGFDNTGAADVSDKLQAALHQYAGNRVLFFPSGTYALAKTVYVPAGSRLHGQVWSVFLADGPAFADASTPTPVFLVGKPGEQGVAQFVDVMFSARGAQPGAVLVQWHMSNPAARGLCGMWDAHFRLGGALVTGLDPSRCAANGGSSAETAACSTANTLLHIAPSGSAYLENVWGWTADHFIDQIGSPQTNIYVQRGFVCEGGPVWMYGTAFEHSSLFQYNFQNAQDVVMAMIQTETPYYQPSAGTPFNPGESDPAYCTDDPRCNMAYALHIRNSSNIYLYGAGLYSFFNVWSQQCLKGAQPSCQKNLVRIVDSRPVYLYSLNTYGTQYMLTAAEPYSEASIQDNTFCSSAAVDLNLF